MLEKLPFEVVLVRNGVEWFSVRGICDYLGIVNTSQAVRNHPKEELAWTIHPGTERKILLITNEPGVYRIMLVSRSVQAKQWREHVATIALPGWQKARARISEKTVVTTHRSPWLKDDVGVSGVLN